MRVFTFLRLLFRPIKKIILSIVINVRRDRLLRLAIIGAVVGAVASSVFCYVLSPNPIVEIRHEGKGFIIKEAEYKNDKYQVSLNKDDVQSFVSTITRSGPYSIEMTGFESGNYISGEVHGLPADSNKEYNILVYVLTDKWYIHPWAENKEGRGFAAVDRNGTWVIDTVRKGHQAFRVAFLLVTPGTFPPPTIDVDENDPDKVLLSRIGALGSLIIEAPEGI
uniref:Uncharacterized protein n=1 Tax=Candidatus Kentrum sp. DK TaxID=2126562 RepID=A0A450SUE5_9GAMM|nr:MAG: hypothetical protein BECKDK2373B_GA0170837_106729 [Candidatus Kentron sp. DK]